jgi:hypothetical protein
MAKTHRVGLTVGCLPVKLAGGALIGLHQVVGPLGACGLGKVYRARDTRLRRDVAIKVLPEAVADKPDWMTRFQREAQVLAPSLRCTASRTPAACRLS